MNYLVAQRFYLTGKNRGMTQKTVKHGIVRNKSPDQGNLYRSLFESSGIASLIIDKEGVVTGFNPAFLRLTGYKRGELNTKIRLHDLIVNGDLMKMKEYRALTGSGADGFVKTFAFKLACKGGAIKDVFISKDPIKGKKGAALAFIDLTSLIDDIGLIKAERKKYRSLIESTDDSIYMVNHACQYLFVNERVLHRLGVRAEDIIGKRYGDFHDRADTQEFEGYVERVFTTGISCRYEHKDRNEERYVLRTLSPILEQGTRQVKNVAVVSKEITDLKKTEEKLTYLSLHDPLTNLYNRGYFEEEMRRHDSSRFGLVGLIMCDIDGLKLVNDILGHDKGDKLLVIASQVIRRSFRDSDVVARVGGDEFAILLPNSPKSKVEDICLRIRNSVAEHNRENPFLPLSISTGFAVRTTPDQSMAELYREADNKMYAEKLHGSQHARNMIVKKVMCAIEKNGLMTEQSIKRLQRFVVALGRALDLPQDRIGNLHLLARFHDIGNVGVHDKIFHKKDRLTDEDIAEIRKHCDVGRRIAQSAPDISHIADHILKHHEWWNGDGYPLGLAGDEIPLESRIMAIADAYESMTGIRPYRKPLSRSHALNELQKNSGSQFDPVLVEKFIEIFSLAPL